MALSSDDTQLADTTLLTEPVAPVALPVSFGRRRPRRRAPLLVWFSALWLIVLMLAAIFANVLPIDDYALPVGPPRQPPGFDSVQLLGTDAIGRSELSRLIHGARQSLTIGVGAVVIGLTLGGLLGLLAGYVRRSVDAVVAVFTDSVLAIPPLLLIVAVTVFFERNLLTMIVALAFLSVPTFTRVARANTLTLAEREFVEAARALGASRRRIVFKELLPNVILPLMSYAFLITAVVIVAEGTLSFLGLGLPPPRPSWGGMIREGQDYLATDPFLILVPSIVLSLTVLSLNIVGDHARLRYEFGNSAK
jgi:peptide/nickel transport system permease protein